MQVEAIYNQGQLQFPAPLRFNRQRFKLLVDIPDQEVSPLPSSAQAATGSSLAERLNNIIGREFREANRGKPSVNTKALWQQHLEEKYLGR